MSWQTLQPYGLQQASLFFTISLSLLKLTSIHLVMPSTLLILSSPLSSWPQSFPASEAFPMSWLFTYIRWPTCWSFSFTIPGWKYYSWAIQHGFEYDKFWETVKDRGAWCTAVHRVAKSQTWLRNWTTATTLLVRVDKHQDLLEEMYFLGSDFSRVACGVCCLSAVLGPF